MNIITYMRVFSYMLYKQGRLSKGKKPDFSHAMKTEAAREMYNTFLTSLQDNIRKSDPSFSVKDGVFGAYMKVSIENDGPVTIILDSNSGKGKGKAGEEEGKMGEE
jgi:D-tyrosyl-tRNA(Tyr) deacylase